MTVKIGGYTFAGWVSYVLTLPEKPGIYAIGCEKDKKVKVIDVGETDDIQDRVKKHNRKDCWNKECKGGTLKYAYYRTDVDDEKRLEIEKKIIGAVDPPCNKE